MFEFTGRLKTISFVLMAIGLISIVVSFGTSSDHDDHHGHQDMEHHDAAEHHGDGHHEGGEHHEEADGHHGEEHHAADHHDGHGEEHHEGEHHASGHDDHGHANIDPSHLAEPEPYYGYHKTASKATPEHNHYENSPTHHDPEHIHHQLVNKPWANLLVNNFFFLAIALGALFFLAIQYAAQAGWATVLLRIMEAMSQFLVIPVLIMVVLIIFGLNHTHHLWHWMAEGIMDPNSPNYDEIIAGKEGYLNGGFFTARTIIYLIGWVGAAMLIRRMSKKMEGDGVAEAGARWKKMRNLSAGFLVFFAVTSSTSAWDWIMSIDTHWFSTLFGWYVFAGIFVSALTTMMLIILYLKNKGYLQEVNNSHIHDVAKFMFAFSIFWTYLWFSQFMLIWYANIPEEVTYYMARFGEYKGLFFTMLALNFLFPVLVLMSRDTKRNRGFIIVAAFIMIIGHWLDVYIMVTPGSVGGQWSIDWTHIGTFLGFAGLFIFVVFRSLAKLPLMPTKHPMYVESKHFHQ